MRKERTLSFTDGGVRGAREGGKGSLWDDTGGYGPGYPRYATRLSRARLLPGPSFSK